MIDIEQIRKDVEMCERGLNEEYYLNWAGLKEEMDTSSVMERCASLGKRETVDQVEARRQVAEPNEDRPLRYLHYSTANFYLSAMVKELTDSKETEEAKLTIDVKGEKMAYRMSGVIMINEDNRSRRKAIHDARIRASGKLNRILKQRMEKLHNWEWNLFLTYRK